LIGKLDDAFAAVGFDDANNNIFAAVATANCFAQHAVSFADTGSVAEKQFESATLFRGRRSDFEPFFRFLRQGLLISTQGNGAELQ
jgi:hypothetical protein